MGDRPGHLGQLVGQAFFGNFKGLRPVQEAAAPPILDGRDVLIRSATASGKTEAVMAPLVDRLFNDMRRSSGVTIVVVSPTRALVNDLHRRLEGPLGALGVRAGIRHGDRDQLSLVEKPHVLLTTPESFDGLVGRREEALVDVRAVVLDEAHLLFNTQRGLQVALTLRRLELWLESEPQVVALSATIGTASEVWRFFRPGRTVVDVAVTGGRPLDYRIRLNESDGDLAARVGTLADQKVLIFVNSRKECELLVDRLRSSGIDPGRVFAHHSSLSTDLRLYVEAAFSEAQHGVCVATSTLELGIDIGSIDLVILHGVPADWKALAQRIGRGNRKQSHIEAVFSVPVRRKSPTTLLDQLSFQGLLAEMNSGTEGKVAAQEILGAYAQQLCSELDARGTFVGINRLAAIGEPWRHLDRRTTVEILDSLVEAGVLQKHPAYNRYGPDDGLHELRDRWQIWSNFSGSGQTINVRTNTRHVGQIGTGNLQALQVGDVILLGGQRWRIDRMNPRDVMVSATQSKPNREVQQDGTPITPSRSLVDWIRRVICDSAESVNVHPRPAARQLTDLVEPIREALRDGLIPLHRAGPHFHYFTFAGSLINDTLAARFGVPDLSDSIVLTTKRLIDFLKIPELVDDLAVGPLSSPRERSGFQNLLPDHLISREDRSILLSEPALVSTLDRLRNGSIVEVEADALLHALGII